eukprot:TRINITY_DN5589_c0_g1_i3.p1 TRINITY_DN5589_c0_g1~~TRINITY_DN5589_c0_g1_i3.p1  ORF type:complete len:115 (-),score=24.45 TRINITY_DN5589_c0_g1_i3:505-849(-)
MNAEQRMFKTIQRLGGTIAILLQSMVGMNVIIELTNDDVVWGKIDQVVGTNMDVELTDVKRESKGKTSNFDTFFVKAESIRYVSMPDDLDVLRSVDHHIRRVEKKTKPKRRSVK